jgi:hypothetical protein
MKKSKGGKLERDEKRTEHTRHKKRRIKEENTEPRGERRRPDGQGLVGRYS